jgi:PPP family 3-phenylpropionic acid transporter
MGSLGRDAFRLITNRDFVLVFASAFFVGATLLPGNDFFSVYVRAIGGTDATTGIGWFVLTAVEAVAFAYVFRLTTRYKYLLVLGAFLYSVKYTVYYFVSSPFLVVASHLVTGVSFAAFYLAGVNLADEIAPETLSSTAQTLLWSATFGVGAGAGQLLAGVLLDSVGVQSMYGYLAVISAGGASVALFVRSDARGVNTGTDWRFERLIR